MKSYSTTRLTTHIPSLGIKRPTAPVYRPSGILVYVLGGPGTGKVTLSEAVAQQSRGKLGHVSMTKVLNDYAQHFEMEAGRLVPSGAAVDMLTARMKAAGARSGIIVSGFPRNIDDIVECTKKISRLDGMILIDHDPEVLQQLVSDGVQSGALTAEEGEQELNDFLSHVLPLTEIMNNKGVLYKINATASDYDEIISEMEGTIRKLTDSASSLRPDQNQNNGQVETLDAFQRARIFIELYYLTAEPRPSFLEMDLMNGKATGPSRNSLTPAAALSPGLSPHRRRSKPVIFVIGGPGSDKSEYCETVAPLYPGWTHISCSWLLRDLVTDEQLLSSPEVVAIRQLLLAGELVNQGLILSCLSRAMQQNSHSRGFIISGFPRDIEQLEQFELEHGRQSDIVLLDCSELQLGRTLGRREDIDDSVKACRRRLELYRTVTLPAMKELDQANRLLVIDGDCEEVQVMDELKRHIYLELQRLVGHGPLSATTTSMDLRGAGDGETWPQHVARGLKGVAGVAVGVTEIGSSRAEDGTREPLSLTEHSGRSIATERGDNAENHSTGKTAGGGAVGLVWRDPPKSSVAMPEVERTEPVR